MNKLKGAGMTSHQFQVIAALLVHGDVDLWLDPWIGGRTWESKIVFSKDELSTNLTFSEIDAMDPDVIRNSVLRSPVVSISKGLCSLKRKLETKEGQITLSMAEPIFAPSKQEQEDSK